MYSDFNIGQEGNHSGALEVYAANWQQNRTGSALLQDRYTSVSLKTF